MLWRRYRKPKEFVVDKPLYNVEYHNFSTYKVFDASSVSSGEDGSVHLYWEDFVGSKWFIEDRTPRTCVFHIDGCSKFKHNSYSYSALVFKNNGSVIVTGAGEAKICNLTFDNDGDATITYSTRPTKSGKSVVRGDKKKGNTGIRFSFTSTKFIANNRGKFIITEDDPKRIYFERRTRLDIRNKGEVHINMARSFYNAEFFNTGDIYFSSKEVLDNLKFNNVGNIYLTTRIIDNVLFRNEGKVDLTLCGKSSFRGKINFKNQGDVDINGEMPTLNFTDISFDNKGDVRFIADVTNTDVLGTNGPNCHMVFTKKVNNVLFKNVTSISCSVVKFMNRMNVNGNNIKELVGSFFFGNRCNVYLQKLLSKETERKNKKRILEFQNGGDVHLESFDNKRLEKSSFPKVNNKGMCVFRANCEVAFDSHRKRSLNTKFPVVSIEGSTEYPNTSYLKRYNVEIHDGVAILYKAIGKNSRQAKYDKIDTKWEVGQYIEHPAWDPYNKEIGEGKYIAGFSPDIFSIFFRNSPYKVVKLEVALSDLYEWPTISAKKPQFIGFRAAKVVEML